MRREEEQMDMPGHAQSQSGVPSGSAQNQNDLFVGTSAHSRGERLELRFKKSDAHAGGQVEDRAA